MKVAQKSKRAVSPHPQVAELVTKLINTPKHDLADVLADIDSWKWPRSDLNAWTKVLDKFDVILEETIRDYDVDKLQINVFTPATKKTICHILRFERLLLENSTNRKTFNSYDRLNSLLFTSDLDVLTLALNLLLRPAQQYSAQAAVSTALSISTPRLLSLSKRWPNVHEHGISLLDLVSANGPAQVDVLPAEARDVSFVYYRTDQKEKGQGKEIDHIEAMPSSPRKLSVPPSTSHSYASTIHIEEGTLKNKEVMEIMADVLEMHPLNNEDKFELLCRVRSAKALAPGNEIMREKLVVIRLICIAIYGHTHSETQASSTLFLYEPDLTTHIAELLQLDRGVSIPVQTAAISALDSIARYRGKMTEVLGAVNAAVNHGIIMALLRKTILEVSSPESRISPTFVESLLSFVTYLAQLMNGGNMLVSAGLIPLLVQIMENRLAQRLQMVSKAMQLMDNVLYAFSNAFQMFSNSRGVEVLVARIQHEVDFDITMYGNERSRDLFGSYGQLPVPRAAMLKHTLRSIHRMMQSTGTSEGLRGLIDSTLPQSIKKIMEYRGLFGPSLLPLAMNIMATFIHNEPTSLPTIQEAGLPQVFYKVIEAGLEPVIEVIQAIPNAIGALCLNQVGQDQLATRPSVIPGIISIFTSESHIKVLREKENAVLIGTAVDELIRHHPTLKTPIFDAVKSALSKIEDLGNTFVIPEDKKEWYGLVLASQTTDKDDKKDDIPMDVVDSDISVSDAQEDTTDEDSLRSHDNSVVLYIDVLCRFLEGLFQHTQHCKDFIRNVEGLERIGRLTALPCLPYDYANSVASDSLVQVIRTMADVGPNEALHHLSKLVENSLSDSQSFWESPQSHSKLAPFLDLSEEQESTANQQFRNLVTLHIRITVLADVFSTAGYAHGRSAIGLLQTLMSDPPKVVKELGALHRASVWENILFKADMVAQGMEVGTSSQGSPLGRSPSYGSVPLPEPNAGVTANGVQLGSASTPAQSSSFASPKIDTAREKNAKALKHLTHGLPSALAPFFQAIVKLFYARRNPDATQKKQILSASATIAEIMVEHLKYEVEGDRVCCLDYHSVMLGLVTILVVDERTMNTTLHTVLLLAFQRAKGLEAIFRVCKYFTDLIDGVTAVKPEDRTETMQQELAHAQGGLKVALHLLHPLLSSKPLIESGQTSLVTTRDKKDTESGYFEPHHFLVWLRLESIPLLRSIWEASWLRSSPLTLVRSVVQIMLEVTAGENEEFKGDPSQEVVNGGTNLAIGSGFHIRAAGPDENRIRQLTDMGFPRSAAERALARTHNNVNAATELLLSQPFPLLPDPQPNGSAAEQDDAGDALADGGDEDLSDEEMDVEDSGPPAPPVESTPPPQSTSEEQGKGLEELRKDLEEARESLKKELPPRALQLVDEHPSLIFEVHRAFMQPTDELQEQSIRTLIDDIQSFSPAAYDVHEQPLAARCRLLAIVLSESPTLPQALGQSLMDTLLALLLSNSVRGDSSHPKWLASHLLVTEALFTIGEQPSTIAVPKEDESVTTPDISVGPTYADARPIIFDFCLRLLADPDLPRDELLSTLRLLVLLTRDHGTASELIKRDGLQHLFSHLKASAVPSGQSYAVIILRHIAEGLSVLQHIMKQEIKRIFSQPRTRIIDVSGYMRNCSAMALRDPSAFVQVTQDLCQLQQPFSAVQHITLKPGLSQPSPDTGTTERNDMQVDQPAPLEVHGPDAEALETMVHFLISELMKNVRSPSDNDVTTKREDVTQSASESVDASKDGPNDEDRHSYCCFIMQCLTELLFSYDACKLAFLSYSPKKKMSTPAKDPGTKHRAAVLQFFLSDLITFRTVASQPYAKVKQAFSLCTCAMSVLVALCVDSSAGVESKDVSADLISVRKFTLEAISRAIKEYTLQDNLDARYGRLLALADLCNRLLTVRFNNGSRKSQDESTTHTAKIMLEKNFVSILTSALAEVDLNYPNVRGLVASILRPMDNLTRIAIKMSRTSEKTKDGGDGKVSQSVVSEDEDEDENIDVDDDDREETPDLYRTSALGMFGGEMEDINYAQEDEMAEGDDDDDDDVEMEYGEDTDSAATSDSEDELEDGGDDDIDEDSNGGEWHDEDEEYEEDDLVENEDGEDGEDDDEPAAGQEVDDEEIMWQDIRGGDDEGDEVADEEEDEEDEEDEDERGEPVAVIHADQGEEPDILSDDEDFHDEMGVIDVQGVIQDGGFRFTDAVDLEGGELDGRDPFIRRRRNTGEDVQVFGRPRHVPAAPPEATVHPLLLDASAATNRPVGLTRVARRSHRGAAGGVQHDLIHSIEDIIAGDAGHIFQTIIERHGPDAIRVDVTPGTMVDGRGFLGRRGASLFAGVRVDGVRVDRVSRTSDPRGESRAFDPLLTVQRWTEEAKTLNGKHVSERANRIGNHVVIALLPAAIEASRQREQQKRQAQAKAEEAEARQLEVDRTGAEEAASSNVAASHASPENIANTPVEPPALDPPPLTTIASNADVEMDDVQASAPHSDENVAAPEASSTGEEISAAEEAPGPSQPAPSERVTVIIHGSAVDITDMGIDPTFLEALPDDIREEVINQHVRDQRAARVERPADSQISPEFLDALPPEIRAELIQQERMEQSRHAPVPAPEQGPPGVAADIDPASFIASLDPQLRQVVLMDSDDGLLQTLPSYMIAEAGVYRDEANGSRGGIAARALRTTAAQRLPPPRKLPPPRDAIQLLDKAGVATLVRLLFFPHVLKKNLLFKILVNICENSKTRSELFNLLLSILQSGPGDLAAVDKSFAQMTTRTPKSAVLQTPKAAAKVKTAADLSTPVAIGGFQIETVPDLVVQRCLEAMTYIVSANEQSSLFFLTEHELPAGLRKMPSRKGKGKEKPMSQTHFPIVLLLGLLDRQSLLKTPSTMDSVVTLLSTVTKPLTSLTSDKEQSNDVTPETSTSAAPAAAVAPTTSEGAGAQESTGASTESPKPDVPAEVQTDVKPLLAVPPQIPHSVLRLIVNILAVGECSSRTFQQSLALIQNLSHIPDARDIIAQELKTKAQDCGHAILADLGDLVGALMSSRDDVLASSVAPKFSSPSSDQTKLLRVLKTIDYMYTPRMAGPVTDATRKSEDAEKVQTIYESFHFAPLWRRLGDCLSTIEEKPELEHMAIVLLPLIEALMVVCKYVGSKSAAARALRTAASPRSPTTSRESMEDLFVSFTDAHRKVLNLMVRNNPSLMSGSFSLLVHNPRVLDFDNKRNYFTQQLHRRPHSREHQGTLQLNVRRARVFEDSFQYLQRKTGDQIKHGKLSVRFYDEEGVDAGGVTREWFQILARQMFDPNNALFQPCAADRLTYQPNKNSWVNPEHLSFFKFVGRIIGKAIYDGRLLDAYFAKSIYRQLLGKPVDYRDVEWVDPEYYNSLCWILDNDPTPLDLTFSVEADEFGVNRIFSLKEGGESIPVTQENKREFVQLSANFRLYSSISKQIENLVAGFQEIIPNDLITIFNEQELELLISGTPDIDVDEWRAATEYSGYTSSDPVIVWWWRALKSFNREERAKVLSFATGTSRVPLGGFVDLQGVQGVQRFSIHRAYGDPDRLPQAHTCFNQIDLPQYSSYEMLRQQLLLAINEGGEGFGFA
ncbi:uncharacterized protein EDB91DRAFT_677858 [Suillus paluster]|uniref:uncharacterized protein n=1 Tax=Suillus paluster TaxID=48578 RepID=UPI001B874C75|nr:uncharacterized protein EDB91DRAFT_677858 [Suillus paluster]KAG1732222.1 hypothetical protein EDB91DRAFT_677858 [Suillus paluster]